MTEILEKNQISIDDLNWIIPHQANMRIIRILAQELKYPEEKIITNIGEYGNTGSASTVIGLSENQDRIKKGDLVGFTVFGGGYSSGAMLVQY